MLQTYFVKKNGDSTFKLAFSVTSAIKSDNSPHLVIIFLHTLKKIKSKKLVFLCWCNDCNNSIYVIAMMIIVIIMILIFMVDVIN